jgi:hypothetical protein
MNAISFFHMDSRCSISGSRAIAFNSAALPATVAAAVAPPAADMSLARGALPLSWQRYSAVSRLALVLQRVRVVLWLFNQSQQTSVCKRMGA